MQKNWFAYSERTLRKGTKIALSDEVYSLWTNNRIEDWDIEGILAHEIGHSMNNGKIFSIGCYLTQGIFIFVALFLGLESLYSILKWNLVGLFSFIGIIPCLFVARQFTMLPEFNADKNASTLVDSKQVLQPILKIAKIQGLINRKRTRKSFLRKIDPFARPSFKERIIKLGHDPKDYGY